MSFFSDLLGRSSARAATQAGERAMGRTREGFDTADTAARTGYDTATGRLQPFAQTAGRGYNLLADSYGVNGADARNQAFQTYASDPFNQHSGQVTQNQLMGIMRTAASRGMGNSGATQLAMSRAGLEAQDRRVGDWRQGLGQFGNQAIPLAGTMAGMDQSYYGGVGDRAMGRANALNQTDINATMAANNARMAGVNNLFKAVGGVAQMAFGMPPTAFGGGGGQSGGTSPGGVPVGGQWGEPAGGYAPDPRRPWA
jgi:hypothetical protein